MRRIKLVLAALIVMVAAFATFAGPAMAQAYPYDSSYYNPSTYNSTDLNSILSNEIENSVLNDLYGYNGYSPSYGY